MEKLIREFTCIRCPMGCALRAEVENGAVAAVSGNQCKRGVAYAKTEAVRPMRTVTSTVRALGGTRPVVAVKTAPDVPRERIFAVMAVIRGLTVTAPVRIGDVLAKNIADTGADLIATANLNKA